MFISVNKYDENRYFAKAWLYAGAQEPVTNSVGTNPADAITTLLCGLPSEKHAQVRQIKEMQRHEVMAKACDFLDIESKFWKIDSDLDCASVWVRHGIYEYRITLDGMVRGMLHDLAGFRVHESSSGSISTETFSTFERAFIEVIGLIAQDRVADAIHSD